MNSERRSSQFTRTLEKDHMGEKRRVDGSRTNAKVKTEALNCGRVLLKLKLGF